MKPVLRLVVLYLQDSKREDEGETLGKIGGITTTTLEESYCFESCLSTCVFFSQCQDKICATNGKGTGPGP